MNILFEQTVDVTVPALSAVCVTSFDKSQIPEGRARDTFLEYTLIDGEGNTVSQSTYLFVKPKQFSYPKVNLQYKVYKTGDKTFAVRVNASTFASKVKLSFDGIEIVNVRDQYFDVTSADAVTVEVETKSAGVTEEALLQSIRVLTEADLA